MSAKNIMVFWGLLIMVAISSGCGYTQAGEANTADQESVPDQARDIKPILIGQYIPEIVLKTVDGKAFDLNAAIAEKPTLLVFYRGGWCPYCNMHLAELKTIEPELIKLGFQIIAVSPDRPQKLRESIDKQKLDYLLLSDSDMTAAKKFGIAFRVDDATLTKYKEYKIDLEGDSGEKHHLLPVPSAFIIDKGGTIHFSYVNPDYSMRVDPDVIMAAAKALLKITTEDEKE